MLKVCVYALALVKVLPFFSARVQEISPELSKPAPMRLFFKKSRLLLPMLFNILNFNNSLHLFFRFKNRTLALFFLVFLYLTSSMYITYFCLNHSWFRTNHSLLSINIPIVDMTMDILFPLFWLDL
jgi:hypothetical protein